MRPKRKRHRQLAVVCCSGLGFFVLFESVVFLFIRQGRSRSKVGDIFLFFKALAIFSGSLICYGCFSYLFLSLFS